jgi:hypothetical protein
MKYILIQQDLQQLGPFTTVVESSDGYICDGSLCPTAVYGTLTVSEVPDDYMTPEQINDYNISVSMAREEAYKKQSDPINFQYQAGVRTKQEWLDARAAIQAELPYK